MPEGRTIPNGDEDALLAVDDSLRVADLNPAAEALLGWSRAELIGQPLAALLPAARDATWESLGDRLPSTMVTAARRDRSEARVEVRLSSRAGEGVAFLALRVPGPGAMTVGSESSSGDGPMPAPAAAGEEALDSAVRAVVQDLGAALAQFWLFDRSAGLLLQASAGHCASTTLSTRVQVSVGGSSCPVLEAALHRRAVVVQPLDGDARFDRDWVQREGIAACAACPVLAGEELLGILVSFWRRSLGDEAVGALQGFAARLSARLEASRLLSRERAFRREAEDQNQKLLTILDLLPAAILLAEGPAGALTFANTPGREMFGDLPPTLSIAEFARRFPFRGIDGEPISWEQHPLLLAFHQKELVRNTVRNHLADGREVVLDVTASPFPGPEAGAVVTFRDVTARLRLEADLAERAAQLKALLDHLPVGVVYFDDRAVCRAMNDAAKRFLGRARHVLIGLKAEEVFLPAVELSDAVHRCLADEATQLCGQRVCEDPDDPESVRYLDWQFEVLATPSGRTIGALALAVDVTDRKKAEVHLRESKEAAERASQNKTRFLSAVSHDLRTPVNALSLQAELLVRLVDERPACGDDLRFLAGDLHQTTTNLIELINDLLDLSRFDSGDFGFAATDFGLDEWLASTLQPLAVSAQSKGLALSWQVDRPGRVVHADRVKLSRVLTNLAGNAVKFTEAGSVAVTAGATPAGELMLQVADTGPGIPLDQQRRIFDEFAQLRNPERDRTKGTGLGLAICRRLVEFVGGRITVSSQVGVGSTFTVVYPADHLPRDAAFTPPEDEPSSRPAPFPGPILLVEDDRGSRQALRRLLSHSGYAVETAADGAQALDALRSTTPGLILLDLMLPGMDGVELLSTIRQEPRCRDVPVVILSGDILEDRGAELDRLGVLTTLGKPVDLKQLHAVLDRVAAQTRDPSGSAPVPSPNSDGQKP